MESCPKGVIHRVMSLPHCILDDLHVGAYILTITITVNIMILITKQVRKYQSFFPTKKFYNQKCMVNC